MISTASRESQSYFHSSAPQKQGIGCVNRVKPHSILGLAFVHSHLNCPCSSSRHLKTHSCIHRWVTVLWEPHKDNTEFPRDWGGWGEKGNHVCTAEWRLEHSPRSNKHSFFNWGWGGFAPCNHSGAELTGHRSVRMKWFVVESRRGGGERNGGYYSYTAIIRHARFVGPEREVSRRHLPLWPNSYRSRRPMCRPLSLMLLMQLVQQLFQDKYSVPITGTEIYISA